MIRDSWVQNVQKKSLSRTGKKSTQYCILSMVLFNCIADGRIADGSTIDKVIEVLTQDSIVPAEGSIWNTYYQAYQIKFDRDKAMLHELEIYQSIL